MFDPKAWYLFEPGLYQLAIRSRLPAAQQFQRWVFEEVLPSIRKTGRYDFSKWEEARPSEWPKAPLMEALPHPEPIPELAHLSVEWLEGRALFLNNHPVDVRTVETDQGPVDYAKFVDLCEALGVTPSGQSSKLKITPWLRWRLLPTGKRGRPPAYLMLDDVMYWVMSINPLKVRPHLREQFYKRRDSAIETLKAINYKRPERTPLRPTFSPSSVAARIDTSTILPTTTSH